MIVTIKKCGVHVSVFNTLGKQKGSSGRFLVTLLNEFLMENFIFYAVTLWYASASYSAKL